MSRATADGFVGRRSVPPLNSGSDSAGTEPRRERPRLPPRSVTLRAAQGVVHVSVPHVGVRYRCGAAASLVEGRRAACWRAGFCARFEASKRLHDSPLRTRNVGPPTCGQPHRDHRGQGAASAAGDSGCGHRMTCLPRTHRRAFNVARVHRTMGTSEKDG